MPADFARSIRSSEMTLVNGYEESENADKGSTTRTSGSCRLTKPQILRKQSSGLFPVECNAIMARRPEATCRASPTPMDFMLATI